MKLNAMIVGKSQRIAASLVALAAMFATSAAMAAVNNLESYLFRFDFSKGANEFSSSPNYADFNIVGASIAATNGPNGASSAATTTSTSWKPFTSATVLSNSWTIATSLSPAAVDNAVVFSVGRLNQSGSRAIAICTSSDKSKLLVRLLYRDGSSYTCNEKEMTGLGDITQGFHTLVVAYTSAAQNHGTLTFYWDGVSKQTHTYSQDTKWFGVPSNPGGIQFNTLVTRGTNATGGKTFVNKNGVHSFYDFRFYSGDFAAADATAYAALYPCTYPFRPSAYVESGATNTTANATVGNYIDTGYLANGETTRFAADFQFLDTRGQQRIFGARGTFVQGLYINGTAATGGKLAWNFMGTAKWVAMGSSPGRLRRIATFDRVGKTIAVTNYDDRAQFYYNNNQADFLNDTSNADSTTYLFAENNSGAKCFGKARIYSFEADENGAPAAFFAPDMDNGEAGFRNIIDNSFHGDGNKDNNPERTLRFYDGVGRASDYKYEGGTLYAKCYASSADAEQGTVKFGSDAAAASAEGWVPHGGTLTLAAVPASESYEFVSWTGDTLAIADGYSVSNASIEVSTPYAVQLRATFKPAVNAQLTIAADGANAVNWSAADWRSVDDAPVAISAPIDKEVTIIAHKSVTLTLDADVSLSRFIVQADDNCVVTFASGTGGSFYASEVVVSNGVFKLGADGILGATPKVTVEDGGTFDFNGKVVGDGEAVTGKVVTEFHIAGAGAGDWPWALTSSANMTSSKNVGMLHLDANATVGGAKELWMGVRNGAEWSAANKNLNLNGFTLTKTGTGTLQVRRPYSRNEGTIDVQSGTLTVSGWSNQTAAYGESCVSNIVLILRDGTSANSELSHPLYFKVLDVRGGSLSSSTGAFGVNEEIILDPIRNPISLQAAPAFASGAKVVLTNSYADVTCGKLVLMTWSGSGAVTPPAFDASCVSGTPDGLTVETAPDGTSHQLVLRVGGYEQNAKAIRIAPIGDSITQGVTKDDQGDYPQYRTTMAAHLAAHGYRPTLCGIWKYADQDKAGVHAPDEWAWHTGVSGDAIITTDKSGGVLDNLHLYLDVIGKPDVITLLIGTNDMGRNGKSAEETYVNWTNLVWEIVRQRPGVKIVASTILDRKDNADGVKAKVAAFNTLLKAGMNSGNLPANLSLVDLFDAVPLATAGNFFSDELHPNWQGHAIMAKGFADGIMSACPYASFTPTVDDTVTNEAQSPLGASGIDELAEYRRGFRHVYTIDVAETNSFPNSGIAPYTATNAVLRSSKKLAKVGYYMELVRKGTNRRRWVWVDMDARGKTLGDVALPWDANPDRPRQFIVEKLHVKSNDSAVHAVAPTDDSVSGVFEGSPYNYSAGGTTAQLSGAPANLMTGGFGWNDNMTGTSSGYGCFQMHRIFTAEQKAAAGVPHDAEVLFAWNRWGSNSDNPNHADDIGIGTYACHAAGVINSSREGNLDYTQTANGQGNLADTVSAKAYQVRRIEIWVVEPPPKGMMIIAY